MTTPTMLPVSGSRAARDSSSMRQERTQAQVQNCEAWRRPRARDSGACGKKWSSRKLCTSSNMAVLTGRTSTLPPISLRRFVPSYHSIVYPLTIYSHGRDRNRKTVSDDIILNLRKLHSPLLSVSSPAFYTPFLTYFTVRVECVGGVVPC